MTNLADIRLKLELSQKAHYASAERYQRLHTLVGGIAVVLTTMTTSMAFFDASQFGAIVKYTVVGLGILGAILVAIQTFSRYLERFEAHRSAAVSYGSLYRKTQYAEDIDLNALLEEWREISEKSPITPTKLRQKGRKSIEG